MSGEVVVGAGFDPAALAYDEHGLVAAVAQDVATGAVLMVAWANQPALERTLATGYAHFYSRSRQELWRKGETSGNTLRVVALRVDCDRDTVLLQVVPAGPACHTGSRTCFGDDLGELELSWLWRVLGERSAASPEASYTARLLGQGVDRIARKVGEEAAETIIAAIRADAGAAGAEAAGAEGLRRAVVLESADLIYHWLVLLRALGVPPRAVAAELLSRHRQPERGASHG